MPRSFSRMATLSALVSTRCQNSVGTVVKPSMAMLCTSNAFMAVRSPALAPALGALPALLAAHGGLLLPQIELAHVLVFTELVAGAFQHDAAGLQNVAVVRGLECHVGVLLDQQHGDALLGIEAMDDAEDLLGQDRRQTERRLVEQHE